MFNKVVCSLFALFIPLSIAADYWHWHSIAIFVCSAAAIVPLSLWLSEVIALAIAVTVTNLISFSGRSNWLDGILLLATYLVLGVAFYYHPA
jgi:Ca2+/H+ antiporter